MMKVRLMLSLKGAAVLEEASPVIGADVLFSIFEFSLALFFFTEIPIFIVLILNEECFYRYYLIPK